MTKMITPDDLHTKITPMDASGAYNWEKQMYQYDACKFGTFASTSRQTCSGQYNHIDDFPMDSVND